MIKDEEGASIDPAARELTVPSEISPCSCPLKEAVRDDRDMLLDEDARQISFDSMSMESSEPRQASETIPLVVLQESHLSSTHTIDLELVQGILDLKRIKASLKNKSFVVDSDGDVCTLCTISTHESLELDYRGLYWPSDESDSSSFYFETATDVDSLDYSFSHSQDVWRVYQSLAPKDEKYFTEGFIDVGELPRVY